MYLPCGPCAVRSWRRGDEDALVRHADNYKVWINLRDRFPHPYTRTNAEEWIAFASNELPETSFAIDVDDEAVGGIGLVLHDDVERCSAEIGYWLGEVFWGRGLATAAVRGLTEWAFGAFPLTRIYAVPYARNVASIRVLEKAGYEREGFMRKSAIKAGIILDQVMMARVRE